MRRTLCLALPAAALLAGCGASADSEAVLETVRATEQAQLQAIAADDLRGAVRNYEDGAVLVVPGSGPLGDAEAIVGAFEALLADPNLALEMTPGSGWAAADGELAVTTSTGRLTSTDAQTGEPVTVPIGNQTVWRKTEGQPWRIVSEHIVQFPDGEAAPAAASAAAS